MNVFDLMTALNSLAIIGIVSAGWKIIKTIMDDEF